MTHHFAINTVVSIQHYKCIKKFITFLIDDFLLFNLIINKDVLANILVVKIHVKETPEGLFILMIIHMEQINIL
jgi:hypothetical protein